MRTIELSEADARELIPILAPLWARQAFYKATDHERSGHPLNVVGFRRRTDREWKAVKAEVRRKEKALRVALEALTGREVPAVDTSGIFRPYGDVRPDAPAKARKMLVHLSGPSERERKRLVGLVTGKAST